MKHTAPLLPPTVAVKKSSPRLRVWPYLFLTPFILMYLLFQIFPILFSFQVSFTDWSGFGEKHFTGFENYRIVLFQDPYFWKSIGNTLLIMLMSTPPVVILGMLLSVFLFNLTRGRSFFQTANFIPYITTPVAIGLIFAFLFDWSAGTVNLLLEKWGIMSEGINWLGERWPARFVVALMIVWKYTGYHMAIYLAGLSAIPADLYEAAKVDGATATQSFLRITMPLLAPITMFLVLTDVIGGLQMFDEPKLLFSYNGAVVGGPDRSVLTAVWHYYDATFSNMRFGYGSAMSFVLFLIIISCTMLGYRLMNRKER